MLTCTVPTAPKVEGHCRKVQGHGIFSCALHQNLCPSLLNCFWHHCYWHLPVHYAGFVGLWWYIMWPCDLKDPRIYPFTNYESWRLT